MTKKKNAITKIDNNNEIKKMREKAVKLRGRETEREWEINIYRERNLYIWRETGREKERERGREKEKDEGKKRVREGDLKD